MWIPYGPLGGPNRENKISISFKTYRTSRPKTASEGIFLEGTLRTLELIFQNLVQISWFLNGKLFLWHILLNPIILHSRGPLLEYFQILKTNFILHLNKFSILSPFFYPKVTFYRANQVTKLWVSPTYPQGVSSMFLNWFLGYFSSKHLFTLCLWLSEKRS